MSWVWTEVNPSSPLQQSRGCRFPWGPGLWFVQHQHIPLGTVSHFPLATGYVASNSRSLFSHSSAFRSVKDWRQKTEIKVSAGPHFSRGFRGEAVLCLFPFCLFFFFFFFFLLVGALLPPLVTLLTPFLSLCLSPFCLALIRTLG